MEFLKNGEAVVSVSIDAEKKRTQRKRSKSKNAYSIDGKEFKAFGNSVPEEIENHLNVGTINFQCQHDPPYLFHASPGQVSRELNSIVSLDSIDLTLSRIVSVVRKTKASLEVTKERLSEAKREMDELRPIVTLKKEYESLVKQLVKQKEMEEKTNTLKGLVDSVHKLEDKLPKEMPDVQGLKQKERRFSQARKQLQALKEQINKVKQLKIQMKWEQERSRLAEKKLAKLQTGKCPICEQPFKGKGTNE